MLKARRASFALYFLFRFPNGNQFLFLGEFPFGAVIERFGTPVFGARADWGCRAEGIGKTGALAEAVVPSAKRAVTSRAGANARVVKRMRVFL